MMFAAFRSDSGRFLELQHQVHNSYQNRKTIRKVLKGDTLAQ